MPVYMIRAGDTDMVKIGWAAGGAEGRCASLQTGHYEELKTFREIHASRAAEQWLHHRYAARRIRGEWFLLHPEMLIVDIPTSLVDDPFPKSKRRKAEPFSLPASFAGKALTTSEIIIKLGGKFALAGICGVTVFATNLWRQTGIPPRYWQTIVDHARDNGIDGITYDTIQAARDTERTA